MLSIALSGCSSDGVARNTGPDPSGQPTARAVDAPAPEAVRNWFHYSRSADFDSIESTVQVPTRDGTLLDCTRNQPGNDGKPAPGPHPGVVMEFTPYEISAAPMPGSYFAEHGYDVLVCNVRGSGNSGGEYPSWFQPQEAADNYDLIEWLAAQPESTGKVAQIGESYGSITAYRAAALRPPHLTTIVPIVSPTNIYAEWVYPGGVPSGRNQSWWANEAPVIDMQAHAGTAASFQNHPLFDDYWKQAVTTNKLRDVQVPALHIGGYSDIFKEGSFDALAQRPDKTWLLTGPWTHNVELPEPGDPETANAALPTGAVLQWFDHWLQDRPEAGLPPSRVVSYESTSGAGQWTQSDQWPSPNAKTRRVFPVSDGTLNTTAPAAGESSYSVNPNDGPSVDELGTMPTDPSQDQAASEAAAPPNQSDRYGTTDPRTTFTLPAFDTDTSVEGPVTFHFEASSTAPDTYFVSKLEVVTTDGKVLPIETGYLRGQLRESLERTVPIPVGEPVRYRIDLGNTHWKFKAGEQLRITLSGGDSPKITPNAPAGIITIHHGADTYVDIPTVD
ncbi:CocE/NonD family hydrolase [Nocardia sp. BMG51109]|uniref:CocE/NonD family hydrolase n=1 Tax=Nocardia sp. BMG51109 TaxID=1056816 RepID=UPI0004BB14E5|nr:CocE/NonD family hydrolase [Nocardia sp. BMG51109]